MDAYLDYLDKRLKELTDSLTHYMINHSAIADLNMEEVYSMTPDGNRYYKDLDAVGTKMQAYLSECYSHFYSTIAPALEGQPDAVVSKMHKAKVLITRTIEHKLTFSNTSREALDFALAALEGQVAIVKEIYKEQKQGK